MHGKNESEDSAKGGGKATEETAFIFVGTDLLDKYNTPAASGGLSVASGVARTASRQVQLPSAVPSSSIARAMTNIVA